MDAILKILEKDGKHSPEAIAAQLNKPLSEVTQKIAEYEKNGVIVRYRAVINHALLGTKERARALIGVKVKPQKDKGFDGVAEKIDKFPEVLSCVLLSGNFDLLVEVVGEDIHAIANFVSQKLAQIENVQETTTHFILKKYKEGGDIFVHGKDARLAIHA
jgi:DNA-binding Lrp family transcriptional regulator